MSRASNKPRKRTRKDQARRRLVRLAKSTPSRDRLGPPPTLLKMLTDYDELAKP